MIPLDIVGILVGVLAVWLFGGIAARLGGLLCIVAALGGIAISPDASGSALLIVGAVMWLAGHWHFAVRHQEYKSPLARQIFIRWSPRWLDPTRGWTISATSERGDRRVFEDRRGSR